MAVDPQLQVVLDLLVQSGAPDLCELGPDEARALYASFPRLAEPPEVAQVEDRTVTGPAGDLPIRVYTPEGDGPFPLLVWFHGGGWVVGSIDTHDDTCRALAQRVGAVVVSVEYRLAPEHPFPAALDDCYATTAWCAEHAAELGADAGRLAVGGDSAGGNLAAAVSLMARDGRGPSIRYQLLVYPVTDFDADTASMVENAEGYFLTRATMQWFYDQYTTVVDRTNPYAAPLRADDLSGLPPALLLTAEFDPLRDEGEAYGARLTEAGTPTTVARYDHMIHGFFSMFGTVDAAKVALDETAAVLRTALRAE